MLKIAIFAYEGVEELDLVGPYEVFGCAADQQKGSCQVRVVAETKEPTTCINGLALLPHQDFSDFTQPDILIIPGGNGSRIQAERISVIEWVRRVAEGCQIVASVCTGLRITAAAGIAQNMSVTTHWGAVDDIQAAHPGLKIDVSRRYIRQGNYISSAGISAGIDMSLSLVGEMMSEELEGLVRHEMVYDR